MSLCNYVFVQLRKMSECSLLQVTHPSNTHEMMRRKKDRRGLSLDKHDINSLKKVNYIVVAIEIG